LHLKIIIAIVLLYNQYLWTRCIWKLLVHIKNARFIIVIYLFILLIIVFYRVSKYVCIPDDFCASKYFTKKCLLLSWTRRYIYKWLTEYAETVKRWAYKKLSIWKHSEDFFQTISKDRTPSWNDISLTKYDLQPPMGFNGCKKKKK